MSIAAVTPTNLVEELQLVGTTISKQTLKDQISDKLASMIRSGLLQIGDELPGERELAAALGVSRETVRRAIHALAGSGMVEISQGARTRVTGHGPPVHGAGTAPGELRRYEIEAVSEARRVVELAVARDAARRISQGALRHLRVLLGAQSALFHDPVRFMISDREFHDTIGTQCGNPVLADFVGRLYEYALDYRRNVMRRPGAVRRSYEDHLSIFAGLQAHDPDAAAQAVAAHLDHIHRTTVSEMRRNTRAGRANLRRDG